MEDNKDKIYNLNVEEIIPNRFQPRLAFDEKELNDLSNSIAKYGVIQPIVVRKTANKYEIIAGERRYKAACLAGLQTIPAIINNTDDNTSAEIALLENLQRKNLTVIEEAQSYKKLIDRGFTQDEIANKLGISQSSIANKLRLLTLPREVREALLYNRISERHARSLLTLNDPDLQKSLLNKIVTERLTVRQTEDEISTLLKRNNNNEIPEEIQRFLHPEPKKEVVVEEPPVENKEDIEIVDFEEPKKVIEVPEEPKENKADVVEEQSPVEEIVPETQVASIYNANTNPFENVDENNYRNSIVYNDNPFEVPTEVTEKQFETPKEVDTNPFDTVQNFSANPFGEVNEGEMGKVVSDDSEINPFQAPNLFEQVNNEKIKTPEEAYNELIDSIKNYAQNNNKIKLENIELLDKYQIIIDINKY